MTIWPRTVRNASVNTPSKFRCEPFSSGRAPLCRSLWREPRRPISTYQTKTVTPVGEIEFQVPTVAAPEGAEGCVALGPDDFHRIGIQLKETRLDVIRRAAFRAAKSLARRQLKTPNTLTEQQLSRIAVSTYRLLDPRQREDRQSRAHVGRIRPGVLFQAGRTEFADGGNLDQTQAPLEMAVCSSPRVDESNDGTPRCDRTKAAQVRSRQTLTFCEDPSVDRRAELDEFFYLINPPQKFLGRLRSRAHRPGLIVAMIVALLFAAALLWNWGQWNQGQSLQWNQGQSLRSAPGRLAP